MSTPRPGTDPTRNDYCEKCDYDRHRCPGCGELLPHGTFQCRECRADLDNEWAITWAPEGA